MKFVHCTVLILVMVPAVAVAQSVNLGDNGSEWANGDECDEYRFGGPGGRICIADRGHRR